MLSRSLARLSLKICFPCRWRNINTQLCFVVEKFLFSLFLFFYYHYFYFFSFFFLFYFIYRLLFISVATSYKNKGTNKKYCFALNKKPNVTWTTVVNRALSVPSQSINSRSTTNNSYLPSTLLLPLSLSRSFVILTLIKVQNNYTQFRIANYIFIYVHFL